MRGRLPDWRFAVARVRSLSNDLITADALTAADRREELVRILVDAGVLGQDQSLAEGLSDRRSATLELVDEISPTAALSAFYRHPVDLVNLRLLLGGHTTPHQDGSVTPATLIRAVDSSDGESLPTPLRQAFAEEAHAADTASTGWVARWEQREWSARAQAAARSGEQWLVGHVAHLAVLRNLDVALRSRLRGVVSITPSTWIKESQIPDKRWVDLVSSSPDGLPDTLVEAGFPDVAAAVDDFELADGLPELAEIGWRRALERRGENHLWAAFRQEEGPGPVVAYVAMRDREAREIRRAWNQMERAA